MYFPRRSCQFRVGRIGYVHKTYIIVLPVEPAPGYGLVHVLEPVTADEIGMLQNALDIRRILGRPRFLIRRADETRWNTRSGAEMNSPISIGLFGPSSYGILAVTDNR